MTKSTYKVFRTFYLRTGIKVRVLARGLTFDEAFNMVKRSKEEFRRIVNSNPLVLTTWSDDLAVER